MCILQFCCAEDLSNILFHFIVAACFHILLSLFLFHTEMTNLPVILFSQFFPKVIFFLSACINLPATSCGVFLSFLCITFTLLIGNVDLHTHTHTWYSAVAAQDHLMHQTYQMTRHIFKMCLLPNCSHFSRNFRLCKSDTSQQTLWQAISYQTGLFCAQ